MTLRNILKGWFSTGRKPTQGQFAELIDSYWHKGEDTIAIDDIDGLRDALTGLTTGGPGGGGGGGAVAAKTSILITDGQPLVIAWQTDKVPYSTVTYGQKHGLRGIIIAENDLTDGKWVPNAAPAFSFETDEANSISTLTLIPQADKTEFIIT